MAMTLRITVALGRTAFAFGRLERLLAVIEELDAGVALEQATQDKAGRWSYTFTTSNRDRSLWRKLLRNNGRFKVVQVEDQEDGQTTTEDESKPGR